jgi:secreted trypsin-like serine protease
MTVSLLDRALSRIPDMPGHVDVRGMLITGKAEVRTAAAADTARDGFVVLLPARSLASVIGRPPCQVITAAIAELTGDVNASTKKC